MLRVKVRTVGKGLHPSEVVVAVQTVDGREELVVDSRSVRNDSIHVGYPVGSEKNLLLVELPRETLTGAWRVWVPEEDVVQDAAA